ncbi:hypothetical protein Clacol_003536 [Clathrus columnatus]|uniref:Short-chain dehydrogenase n=1 Tax=Clathrus columnatus TaxID=1419009 RepID=A0AAV5A3T8_9AGAM|nr:hypothetical protein Clacol_003536 [Clathrus columnatus]
MVQFDSHTTAETVAKAFANEIKDKTVLITGVTLGGFGAEAARVLALVGAKVILAGRSVEKIRETANHIKKETPSAELHELVLDLGSQQAVRQAAAQVLEYQEPIDVLILNAGTMCTSHGKTPEGIELQFATNHIGNFLFTNLIIPKLLEATAPRVVTIASVAHLWTDIRYDDINLEKEEKYDKWIAYGQSKTANILFALELAERYKDKKLLAFSLHPGGSLTSMTDHMTTEDYLRLSDGWNPDGTPKGDWIRTVEECAANHIVAGFDPSIADKSGSYLVECQVTTDPQHLQPYASNKVNPTFES